MAAGGVPDATKYRWERLPDMPTARTYCVAAYLDKHIYVVGGCGMDGKAMNIAEVYSITKKEWEKLPPAPHKRAGCENPVCLEQKVIFVGGTDENQKPLAEIDVFNTATKTWESFPPLPSGGRIKPVVKLIGRRLFVIAGANEDRKGESDGHYLDLDKLEWVDIPPMKEGRYTPAGHVYANKLYVIGGRTEMKPVDGCEILDLETLQWEPMAMLPKSAVFYSVVGLNADIFVIGGMQPPNLILKKVYRYRIGEEDSWDTMRDLMSSRTDFAAGVVCGRVVVTGGLGIGEKMAVGRSETEALTGNKRRWERLPSMLKSRLGLNTVCWEGNMAVVGGLGQGGPLATVEILTVDE